MFRRFVERPAGSAEGSAGRWNAPPVRRNLPPVLGNVPPILRNAPPLAGTFRRTLDALRQTSCTTPDCRTFGFYQLKLGEYIPIADSIWFVKVK
jgi:hypothetical protein